MLTPTYHVFEMYKVHQGATLIPVELKTPDYEVGAASVPMLHASASRDALGVVHLSIVNLDANRPATVLASPMSGTVTGRILTAPAMDSRNTFNDPDAVGPATFDGFGIQGHSMSLRLPPKSVVVLESSSSTSVLDEAIR